MKLQIPTTIIITVTVTVSLNHFSSGNTKVGGTSDITCNIIIFPHVLYSRKLNSAKQKLKQLQELVKKIQQVCRILILWEGENTKLCFVHKVTN